MDSAQQSVPEALARFPKEARDAYDRFVACPTEADLMVIVGAALVDFMPNRQEAAKIKKLDPSTKLIADLRLDSLAVAELVFFFEDLFRVSIPGTEILNLETVGDLAAYVSRKLSETRARG